MYPLNIQDENWSFKCTRKICSESSKTKAIHTVKDMFNKDGKG